MRFLIPLTLAAVAALAGCTTPAVTRNVFAELDRLCEEQAGIRVYMPERWHPEVRAIEVPCTSSSQTSCWFNPAGRYFTQTTSQEILKTAKSSIHSVPVRWVTEPEGLVVAEQIAFTAFAPAPLLSDHPTQHKVCAPGLAARPISLQEKGASE